MQDDASFDAESDNLVSLFGFDIHTDNSNNTVNGCPLAIQHMLQQHQVLTFNGMKDPAHCTSPKTELINHEWVKHKEYSTQNRSTILKFIVITAMTL